MSRWSTVLRVAHVPTRSQHVRVVRPRWHMQMDRHATRVSLVSLIVSTKIQKITNSFNHLIIKIKKVKMWTNLVSRAHSSQTVDSHDCDRSQSGRAVSSRVRWPRRCSPTLRSPNVICWHRRWWHFSRHGRTIRTNNLFFFSLFSSDFHLFFVFFLKKIRGLFACFTPPEIDLPPPPPPSQAPPNMLPGLPGPYCPPFSSAKRITSCQYDSTGQHLLLSYHSNQIYLLDWKVNLVKTNYVNKL